MFDFVWGTLIRLLVLIKVQCQQIKLDKRNNFCKPWQTCKTFHDLLWDYIFLFLSFIAIKLFFWNLDIQIKNLKQISKINAWVLCLKNKKEPKVNPRWWRKDSQISKFEHSKDKFCKNLKLKFFFSRNFYLAQVSS